MQSLVIQTSFIGDVVLTTPLIQQLARDGDVHVVTTAVGATLLQSHPAVTRLAVYDKRRSDAGIRGLVRLAQESRGSTRAFLCQGSVRSGALAFAAGCGERIGFDTSSGSWTYTRRVEYRRDWHHARRLLSLGDWALADSAAELTNIAIRPTLYPTRDDALAVDALLNGTARPVIAFAPGSALPNKRWNGFAALARLLVDEFDLAIVGGEDDREAARQIALESGTERVTDAAGKLSLLASAELISRSAVLVTNDSSPQHLASAMGTPTVTIFGPTVPELGFGPLAPGSRTVGNHRIGQDVGEPVPLGQRRRMSEITPDEVANMVRSVISREPGI